MFQCFINSSNSLFVLILQIPLSSLVGAIIGTNQVRETTPTENTRPYKVMGVEHRASNPVL
jgi:hypothetical protein